MKKTRTAAIIGIIIKAALIICGIIGISATASGSEFMSAGAFLYYTVQSNLWIMVISAVFLIFDILFLVGKEVKIPNWLYVIKFMFTGAITLTFLVFSVMLTPQMIMSGFASYLYSASNLCCHNLVPILAILDWTLFNHGFKANKLTFLWNVVTPIYYLAFALICSFNGVTFGGGAKVPYFFLDYEANGWFNLGNGKFGVFYWIIVILILVLAIGLALMAIKNAMQKRQLKR